MRKNNWYKSVAVILVIFLAINTCSMLVFSDNGSVTDSTYGSLDGANISNLIPFKYGLFNGDENWDLRLMGASFSGLGDIRTNSRLVLSVNKFELDGVCETVKGCDLRSLPNPNAVLNSVKIINNQPIMELPDIYDEFKNCVQDRSDLFDFYPSNYDSNIGDGVYLNHSNSTFSIGGSEPFVVDDKTYCFDGNLRINNNVKFIGKGIIIATGDIYFFGPLFDTTNGSAFIYSKNKNILYASSYSNIKAIFYAPNGRFEFNGNNAEITGKVIAKQILFYSTNTRIVSHFLGFDEILHRISSNIYVPTPTPTSVNTTKSADVNGDNVVNMSDVIIFASVFNAIIGDLIYVEAYDLNSDGVINMMDIMILASKFNTVIS